MSLDVTNPSSCAWGQSGAPLMGQDTRSRGVEQKLGKDFCGRACKALGQGVVGSPSLEGFQSCGCDTWGHGLVVTLVVLLAGLEVFSSCSDSGFLILIPVGAVAPAWGWEWANSSRVKFQ